MTVNEVADLVRAEVGDGLQRSNAHGVDLARCLVPPSEIDVIARDVRAGKITGKVLRVWLVLEERPVERDGYKIVLSEATHSFGLVSSGYPTDPYPILCGWYGSFVSALEGM